MKNLLGIGNALLERNATQYKTELHKVTLQ